MQGQVRCLLRLSSLSEHRLLQSRYTAQYPLPYPAEAEHSTDKRQADQLVRSRSRRSGGKIPTPLDSDVQKLDVSKQKNGKRKPPAEAKVLTHAKLLVGREEAAEILSISLRSVDYLVATGRLSTRRIGTRVLIPLEDVRRFACSTTPTEWPVNFDVQSARRIQKPQPRRNRPSSLMVDHLRKRCHLLLIGNDSRFSSSRLDQSSRSAQEMAYLDRP
jgi:excisionase family DNA binding protein